jgi:type II secretory pathway pseudopilin PulG
MRLAGQPLDAAHGTGNRGYAMAALLVGMSVMAVLMSALLPVWSHMAQREKEEELIFRGGQYARAIDLFQRKFGPGTSPPTVDVLVEQKFLRKKYKDPITKDDFQPIYANQQGALAGGGSANVSNRPGQTATARLSTPAQQQLQGAGTSQGPIIGFTSKSKDESIKLLNGRSRYNEWAFVPIQTNQAPGQPGGAGGPGQPGRQQPIGPGGIPGGVPGGPSPGMGQPMQGQPIGPPKKFGQ